MVRGNIVGLLGMLETIHADDAGGRAHDECACVETVAHDALSVNSRP
jgi:hypothetical protein